MDDIQFDRLTRRLVLSGFAAALGLGTASRPDGASARRRKKKPQFNEFGCVNVGGKCRGKDSVCCSGICRGKKPKKGKKDKRRCVDHDTGGCAAGEQEAFCGGTDINCVTTAGESGVCNTTTGNAGYCTSFGGCFPCSKDADCRAVCGDQAACTICDSCDQTGGTSCDAPSDSDCNFA
jgi:hypothetical protein